MLYSDPFKNELIKTRFTREMILKENEDRFKSVVLALDLNRINEYPIENKEAYEMSE